VDSEHRSKSPSTNGALVEPSTTEASGTEASGAESPAGQSSGVQSTDEQGPTAKDPGAKSQRVAKKGGSKKLDAQETGKQPAGSHTPDAQQNATGDEAENGGAKYSGDATKGGDREIAAVIDAKIDATYPDTVEDTSFTDASFTNVAETDVAETDVAETDVAETNVTSAAAMDTAHVPESTFAATQTTTGEAERKRVRQKDTNKDRKNLPRVKLVPVLDSDGDSDFDASIDTDEKAAASAEKSLRQVVDTEAVDFADLPVEEAQSEQTSADWVESSADGDVAYSLPGESDGEATPGEATPGEATPGEETSLQEASRATARTAVVMNAVKIRGRPGGVAIEIGEGEWAELLTVLRERLEMAEGFFRGGRVVLDVGARAVDETQLQEAFDVLTDFEMLMALVRADTDIALEAAAALGVTATTGGVEDPSHGLVEANAGAEAEQALIYYVHQGNLRSGQVLERAESVIVIGDVNPGAQVVSHGDVLVWGRLRGSAHAGSEGDEQAMVTAMEFSPTQLRIAGFTSVPPDDNKKPSVGLLFWKKEAEPTGAEFAYVADGRIYVEPWNPSKPGGLNSRRRSNTNP
jgi:septum site-determining protein MinC